MSDEIEVIEEKLIHIRDHDYPYLEDFGLFYFSSMLEYPKSVRELYNYYNHHKEFGVDTLLLWSGPLLIGQFIFDYCITAHYLHIFVLAGDD
jgi:hypothetical protein